MRSLSPITPDVTRWLAAIVLIGVVLLSIGTVAAHSGPVKRIPGLGEVIDPDGDCTITASRGNVTIGVPATPHDLSNYYPKKSAPRILREVDGDFTVQVNVSGEFDPGKEASVSGYNAFNGAGLLIWQDDAKYIRLERNVWITTKGRTAYFPPLLEFWKSGKRIQLGPKGTYKPFFTVRVTALGLRRRGNQFWFFVNPDGRHWLMGQRPFTAEFSRRLKVGVDAINTSHKPFTAVFQDFRVTTP